MLELCFKGPKGSKISCFHFLSFHLCVSDMLYRKHYREELWYFLCFQEDKRQKNVSAGETEVASVDLKSEVGTLRRIDAGLLTSKHFFIAVLIVLISAAAYYFQKQNYPCWCRGWSFSLPDMNEILSFVLGNLHAASECTILRLIHDELENFIFWTKWKKNRFVCGTSFFIELLKLLCSEAQELPGNFGFYLLCIH